MPVEFKLPNGEKRMMVFEVRHWVTNAEAEIGTPAFGGGGVPLATGAPEAA
jgi:hypothetical protein